jgi:hypothetical protein
MERAVRGRTVARGALHAGCRYRVVAVFESPTTTNRPDERGTVAQHRCRRWIASGPGAGAASGRRLLLTSRHPLDAGAF